MNTDFSKANLTGACIEDWHINGQTNFDDVICDYIYLKYDWESEKFLERRPSDESKIFAPGDFKRLIEKAKETVDLIFNQGIDWSAFLNSFNNLRIEDGYQDLGVKAIEQKDDGTFVVRLNTTNINQVDKGELEKSFWKYYQPILEAKEDQIKFLQDDIKARENKENILLNVIKTMAEKENQINIVNQIHSGNGDNVGNNKKVNNS